MRSFCLFVAGLAGCVLPLGAADTRDLFETRVRPVLAKNCFGCHTQAQMGGLRLDSKERLLKGGKSGPAVIPGNPDKSILIHAITYQTEGLKMPPSGKLKEQEIADLQQWIAGGAYWPEGDPPPVDNTAAKGEYVITPQQKAFWSFQPVKLPKIPEVKDKSWPRNDIDRFVLSRLESEGLKPVRFADKRTLIRRATLDLTGLPPTPEEVEAFLRDKSPQAYAKVVDRLLASPHYGERWGRLWLDIARYSDDRLNSTQDDLYPNSYRYRDWVIRAFNEDMPYDMFVKAQLAGDYLKADDPNKYAAGLGFYALSPEMQDDRVDATTRGFLGLTVACATCHDHKFDPIPTKDYYSLQGIFTNTELHETPLAPEDVVKVWQDQKKQLDKKRDELKKFNESQTAQLGEILASNTARYMLASRGLASGDGLDPETLTRWKKYLEAPKKDHPFLKEWADLVARKADAKAFESAAQKFQDLVLVVNDEKKSIDDKNHISLGIDPSREKMASASLLSLDRDKFVLWRNLFDKNSKDAGGFVASGEGVYYYGGTKIDRFLSGEWKTHLETLRKDVERLEKALPPQYPFLQTVADKKDCKDGHIYIRGDASNKGEIAPRRFLQILSEGERKHFTKGSGRLELAEAIADPKNPLTARVMVNRIWQNHFGRGIVATPSNFGQLGERPTHPELLDYLASQFVAQKWSMKAMHRMIMLSSTYALAAESDPKNVTVDADNRLLWRANRKRMDAETLRDSVLFVAGDLDLSGGGKAEKLDENNRRRTVYGFVSRRKLDGMLALFDFPNPNSTSEQRMSTNVPPQRLFLMNSPFIETEAENLAKKLPDGPVERKIASAYERVLSREPLPEELKLAEEFLKDASWKQYARVLLSANEFGFID